jgi:hypothetical protein
LILSPLEVVAKVVIPKSIPIWLFTLGNGSIETSRLKETYHFPEGSSII